MLLPNADNIPSKDKNGNTVYLAKNAIPSGFLGCHKNFDNGSVKGRVEKFIPEFNKILEKCVDDGTIMTKDLERLVGMKRQQKHCTMVMCMRDLD